jgi:multidrug efflux system membrane fusion protein
MRKSYIIALAVILLAAAWVASGQFSSSAPEGALTGPQTLKSVPQARVAHLTVQPITRKIVVQGETQPSRIVEIKAEIRGEVIEETKPRGAAITAGEPLFQISDDGRTAQVEKAKAEVELRQAEFEAAKSLSQTGFQTSLRLAEARSNLLSAQAELTMRQLDADNLTIRAPFDGVLDERSVEVGDFVEVGRSVGTAVQLDPIKIVGAVSESNIGDIEPGMDATVSLIDGREVPARVTFKASTSNSDTRTFDIELEAPNPDGAIAGGLTATIRLAAGQRNGHLISPSSLTLSDSGLIGVKVVDDESRVHFVQVQILEEGADGTWIGGLPDEVDLVTVGQDFLSENELVERVYSGDAGT